MLTVTDEFTRQSLAITAGFSLKSKDVADALSPLIAERGAPKFLRSDNSEKSPGAIFLRSEFVALTLRGFLHRSGVSTAYTEQTPRLSIDKGSPFGQTRRLTCAEWFRREFSQPVPGRVQENRLGRFLCLEL